MPFPHTTHAERGAARGRRRWGRPGTAVGLAGLLAAAFVMAGPGIGARAASAGAAGYAIASLNDGSPAGWTPCRTVTWGLAAGGAGVGAASDVHHAIRLAGEVTGLRFVYVDAPPPVPQRAWLAPGGWPRDAPDLVVAWAVASAESPAGTTTGTVVSDLLVGAGEAAVGGWSAEYAAGIDGARRGHITHGYVVLDALADEQFTPSFVHPDSGPFAARRPLRGRLLLHELGHALGLSHVHDDKQVMHAEIGAGAATWGVGDRAGLQAANGGTACGGDESSAPRRDLSRSSRPVTTRALGVPLRVTSHRLAAAGHQPAA